jgi:hypothetical protein
MATHNAIPATDTARPDLALMFDLLCERTNLVCEIGTEARLITTDPAQVAA